MIRRVEKVLIRWIRNLIQEFYSKKNRVDHGIICLSKSDQQIVGSWNVQFSFQWEEEGIFIFLQVPQKKVDRRSKK